MTNPASKVVRDYMAANVAMAGWPMFIGMMPVPDSGNSNCVATYDTGGLNALQFEEGIRQPTVQVRVRSKDYESGWQKANEIFTTLGTLYDESLGSDRVVGFVPRSDVLFVGRDETDLYLFTINFDMIRDMS